MTLCLFGISYEILENYVVFCDIPAISLPSLSLSKSSYGTTEELLAAILLLEISMRSFRTTY